MGVEAYAGEWLQLLVRWIHLITGIAWIGASFYFVWLDNSLLPPKRPFDVDDGVGGELWAVHGGGFYRVQKFRIAPAQLLEPLHWFKWEAYSTWLSGLVLFALIYWWHADTYLFDRSVSGLAPLAAVGISAALFVIGWIFYDQLCKRLRFDHEYALGLALIVFFGVVAYELSEIFTGRGLFLQIGAMLGTLMAANVLFVIIPAQRQLVASKQQGHAPDPVHGLRGKQRSVHNNYFTLPVLLLMISPHYPLLYGQRHAWLMLSAVLLLAAYVRHFFNLRHKGKTVWAIPISAALGALIVAIIAAPTAPQTQAVPSFAEVQAIIDARCTNCHAAAPRQAGFALPPKNVTLDTPAGIRAQVNAIAQQAVLTHAMPLGNLTGMTDAERARLGAWIAAGAPDR